MTNQRNPVPTVDTIIEIAGGIVLINRRFAPFGWALPGGFVDYGESLEAAAIREAREETGLAVTLIEQFYAYSDPTRDPRRHTIATVFIGRASGTLRAADDAADAGVFSRDALPHPFAFDHALILADYFRYKETGIRPLHGP
ncbi:MAG TPA: NUDIX hydrolase [Candidatus Binatia bacterium]|nr:NUDIX hydrolase [Candidatus Binatia bacterium]